MEQSSSSARRALNVVSPLEDAGILLHVLTILGPGHHLFISAVSKAWRDSYERVPSVMVSLTDAFGKTNLLKITHQTTLCSAVFASASRVHTAHECGLTFHYSESMPQIAGRVADVSTLQLAHELRLKLTEEVLFGATEAASVPKLHWLHTDKGCELSICLSYFAARSGSIRVLNWLKDRGLVFDTKTCRCAAAGAHLHVLQYLQGEGCEWHEVVCSAAADNGHLTILQWLREQGCPWRADVICGCAASSGSIEMLLYLKRQGCPYNEITMACAASKEQLGVYQYLVAEQCPFDAAACDGAARGGHLETVRFLRENGFLS
jgi:hypothetical protein